MKSKQRALAAARDALDTAQSKEAPMAKGQMRTSKEKRKPKKEKAKPPTGQAKK